MTVHFSSELIIIIKLYNINCIFKFYTYIKFTRILIQHVFIFNMYLNLNAIINFNYIFLKIVFKTWKRNRILL